MKQWQSLIVFIVIACAILGAQDKKEIAEWKNRLHNYKPPIPAQKMKFVRSFPDESSAVLLSKVERIFVDERGLVYASDTWQNKIIVFDFFSGKCLRTFGRLGQGPGDFNSQRGLCLLKDDMLAVYDTNNARIQLLSANGNYLSSFKTFSIVDNLHLFNGHLLYMSEPIKQDGKVLIEADLTGKTINSYGEVAKELQGTNVLHWMSMDVNNHGDIFYMWKPLARVYQYNPLTKTKKELTIAYPNLQKLEKENLDDIKEYRVKYANASKAMGRELSQKWILQKVIAKKDGGFYLIVGSPFIEVVECDENGKIVRIDQSEPEYKYFPLDFSINVMGNTRFLIMSEAEPEAKINIYEFK
jgi:hypothetical protein